MTIFITSQGPLKDSTCMEIIKSIQKISHLSEFRIRIQSESGSPNSIIIEKKEKKSKSVCASSTIKSKKNNTLQILKLSHIEKSFVKNPQKIYHLKGIDLQLLIDDHLKIEKIRNIHSLQEIQN